MNPDDLSYLHYDKVETFGSSHEIPVLVLPTGKRIEFQLASADVIHAFWVPEFLFKRDVMPNPKENQSDNVFQITEITKEGAFVGRCAEMCGTYHSMMNFEVRVVGAKDSKVHAGAHRGQDQRRGAEGHQRVAGGHLHVALQHPARCEGASVNESK